MKKEFVPITKEGLEKIKLEIKQIKEVEIPQTIENIKKACQFGDRSENSEYIAEKNKKSLLDERLANLTDLVSSCELITKNEIDDTSVISFSAFVTFIKKPNNKKSVIRIVSTVEADPLEGLISYTSPLAKKMLGKKEGYLDDEITILKVEYK